MFKNRTEAGILLAKKLGKYKNAKDTIVIAIPRGGVVVGYALAEKLSLPLSAIVIKKMSLPSNPELAIGAVASDGTIFWDEDILSSFDISETEKNTLLEKKQNEAKIREKEIGIEPFKTEANTIILVDDGVATGSTAKTASLMLKRPQPKKLILATPVIAEGTKQQLEDYFDGIIALKLPYTFHAVGEFYEEFEQVDDEKVKNILSLTG